MLFSLSPNLTQPLFFPPLPCPRSPDPAAGRSDRAGLQRKPWRSSAAFLPRRPSRGPARCRAGPGAFGAHGTPGARSPRCLATAHASVHRGTLLSGADWPGRSGAGPAPGGPPALCCSSCPFGGEMPAEGAAAAGENRACCSSPDRPSSAAQWSPGFPGLGHRGPAQPPHCQLLGPSGS